MRLGTEPTCEDAVQLIRKAPLARYHLVIKQRQNSKEHIFRMLVLLCVMALPMMTMNLAMAATSKSPLSVRLSIPTTRTLVGTIIRGVVDIDNSSSRPVIVDECRNSSWLVVGLSNDHSAYNPIYTSGPCARSFELKPGNNQFDVTISTKYNHCFRRGGEPRCISTGAPNLPPGKYVTSVVARGLPAGTPTAPKVAVTLI
jgi:hypothetical protein